jgi:multidrug efflux pump subunit AcrB
MLISLYSPGGSYDANFLINYASINLRDQILRIPGIAQVDLFGGTDYGLRVWIRPDKLAKLGLTPSDVISAIKEQNLQAPTGRVGAAPTPADQAFTFTVSAPGRLVTAEEFENIIIRAAATGIRCTSRCEGAPSSAARTTTPRPAERQIVGAMGCLSASRAREPAPGGRDDYKTP